MNLNSPFFFILTVMASQLFGLKLNFQFDSLPFQRYPGHQEGAPNLPTGLLLPVCPPTEVGLMGAGY